MSMCKNLNNDFISLLFKFKGKRRKIELAFGSNLVNLCIADLGAKS